MEQVIASQSVVKPSKPFFLVRMAQWIWDHSFISAFVLLALSYSMQYWQDDFAEILGGTYYIGGKTQPVLQMWTFMTEQEKIALHYFLSKVYSLEYSVLSIYAYFQIGISALAMVMAARLIYRTFWFFLKRTDLGARALIVLILIPALPLVWAAPAITGYEAFQAARANLFWNSIHENLNVDRKDLSNEMASAVRQADRWLIKEAPGNSALDKADWVIMEASKVVYGKEHPERMSVSIRVMEEVRVNGMSKLQSVGWKAPILCRWFEMGCDNWQKEFSK